MVSSIPTGAKWISFSVELGRSLPSPPVEFDVLQEEKAAAEFLLVSWSQVAKSNLNPAAPFSPSQERTKATDRSVLLLAPGVLSGVFFFVFFGWIQKEAQRRDICVRVTANSNP